MSDFETADFYTDTSLVDDPHAYFHYLRSKGPVTRLPYRNVVAITGYEETVQVLLDTQHFSSANVVTGPIPELPFTPEGDDISAQLEAARPKMVFQEIVATADGLRHSNLRSIMAKFFTPGRMKTLEASLRATADAMIDEFIAEGRVELVKQYAGPYATLIISDLLGIPPKGRQRFREILKEPTGLHMGSAPEVMKNNPLIHIGKHVFGYLVRRRLMNLPPLRVVKRLLGRDQAAGDDILTELALARFPDGSPASLTDLTALGAFMFGAGQDTTVRLHANAFRVLATRPDLQELLRADPARIPDFIEEILRYDGAVKSSGRLCIRTTTIGGVEIKAGTTLLVANLGANRDPRRFENPDEFNMDRPRLKEHLAFGRGPHTCIGAALARSEVRVSIERLLARMGNIRLSEAHHGPEGARHFEHEPTTAFHGPSSLHLEFDRL